MQYILEIVVLIFGMCTGSFLNVCIYRLPAGKSIINPPRSFCPSCGSIIRFYDNIPVFSYIWLKRRCRHCSNIIPLRYPLVEIISAFFALSVFIRFGLTPEGFVYYLFISSLLVMAFIDIDHRIIPDVITLPGIPVFFLCSFVVTATTYKESLIGILAGGGSLLFVASLYSMLTKKEGLGGGDIKLLAMIGALLGWKGVFFTIFVSSALGALVGIIFMLRTEKGMKLAIPFGPFLSAGAVLYIFFGTRLINLYLNLLY